MNAIQLTSDISELPVYTQVLSIQSTFMCAHQRERFLRTWFIGFGFELVEQFPHFSKSKREIYSKSSV